MKGSLQIKGQQYYAVFRVNGNKTPTWFPLGIEPKRGNKRQAERAMAELVAKYQKNPNEFNKIDFVEYIKKWLIEVKPQIDIITFDGYKQYVEKHIIPYFEEKHLMLQDISIKDIEGYYNFKSVGGRLDGKPGGLSTRTIKLHSVVLSLVFKKAIYNGLLNKNPCDYAQLPNTKKKKPIAKFYTQEQCKKLLNIINGTPLYDMVYITTIYGLRRSELVGLKWSAVDFVDNTISIQHTVVVSSVVVEKDKTKTQSSARLYPLLPDVKKILLNIKKEQQKYRNVFGNSYVESDYVFTKQDGKRYYPEYPSKTLQKQLKQHNLPHIRFHDLRHTAASLLLVKGWSMKDISDWLGHSNIGITMNTYSHIDLAHKREMSNMLNGVFDN